MNAATKRRQDALPVPVAAPVGGLNARDALAAMPPGDASVLTNMFAYADRVETRGGFDLWSTASTIASVQIEGFHTLMSWGSGSTSDSLFAVYTYSDPTGPVYAQARIYSVSLTDGTLTNVRTVGAAGSFVQTGEWTQFGASSGTNYTILMAVVAGVFSPQAWDGSSWSTLSITGVSTQARGITSHRRRLWFYNSITDPLKAYYLPVGAVAGAAVEFNLAPFVTKGGRIVAMRTWTRDGGEGGSDDLAVFFTNRGEAVIYAGTDPASAATWGLVGVFNLGIPASFSEADNGSSSYELPVVVRDSFAMKYGADLLFLMQSGITSANKIIGAGDESDHTISAKINPLITDASKTWVTFKAATPEAVPNWKMLHVPALKALFISIPTASTSLGTSPTRRSVSADIYVMNTETGAWFKFEGFKVRDMLAIGGSVFITDGSVSIYKYTNTAATDNGTTITFECRQAYNYLNLPTNKNVTVMQPMLRATGNFSLTVQADADFNNGSISAYTSYTVGSTQNLQPILSANQYGRAFAAHLKGQTSAGVVSWYATNWLMKPARVI